jgi:glycosyltransferase involved in cell wall biosynthesis
MTPSLRNDSLYMDDRMLVSGTGVAGYAAMLRAAQQRLSDSTGLLSAGDMAGLGPKRAKLSRVLRALSPFTRPARREGRRLIVADLFRLAQIFFDIHGRLLTVRTAEPQGIMHWAYPVPIRLSGWKNIYTIHDVIPLTHPALTSIDAPRHRRLLTRISEHAARIVTVSDASRTAIIAALDCPSSLVVNCSQPVALDRGTSAGSLPAPLRPGQFLLVCGSVEPRKNIERIVRAHRASGVDLPIVLAGPDGQQAESLRTLLTEASAVVRLPFCSRDEILHLIENARALLMPSLAEGFGLPVAEAMALGVPVITSNEGALAEIAGGSALLVDPLNEAEIASAIQRVVSDEALREALARQGRVNARRFTLDRFVDRLAALYIDCLGPNGRSAL